MIKKKILFIFLVAILILNTLGLTSVFALADSSSLQIYCPNVILVERKTGKILYEKNAREKIYNASTTKLLTAILVLENCKLDDVVTVKSSAVDAIPWDYTRADLRAGEKFTVEQLLNVLLIPSANDAANVLAEHVSGSVEKFADLMNQKAQEIGCTNTHFTNPSGMHDENHYSTAYDLYLIGNYAYNFETIRDIVKKTEYSLPATDIYNKDDRKFVTTNSMLRDDMTNYYLPYVKGMKTGYTDFSKDCIVAIAEKDGVEYIAVVMGGGYTSDKWLREKYLDCKTLFEFAFENYGIETLAQQGDVCTKLTIGNATEETKALDIVYKDTISAFMDKSISASDLNPEIKLNDFIKAPVKKGDKLGTVTYTIDGQTFTSDLIANTDVVRIPYLLIAFKILIGPAIIVTIFLVVRHVKNGSKNHRL